MSLPHELEQSIRRMLENGRGLCKVSCKTFQHVWEHLQYDVCDDTLYDMDTRDKILRGVRAFLRATKGPDCPLAAKIATLMGKKSTCKVIVRDRDTGRSRQCRNNARGHFCKTHGGSRTHAQKKKKAHSTCKPTKRFNGTHANRYGRFCKYDDEKHGYYSSSSDEDSDHE